MTRLLRPAVVALALLLGVREAGAQQGAGQRRCELSFEPLRDSTSTFLETLPSGRRNAFQGGGVRYRCQGQDVVMEADSAAYYGDMGILYLIGQVHYRDQKATLDADRLTYYQNEEWVVADGNVNTRLSTGSTMRGPAAEYYRVIPGVRPQSRLNATGRPVMMLQQPDSAGRPRPPVQVIADRVSAVGDSLVYAGGSVQLTRTDLVAQSDSAALDQGREFGRLVRHAQVTGKGKRPFTLNANTVDLYSRDRQLQRVVAVESATARSEDVTVTSDTLDLRVRDNELERAFAWGPGRARATSPGRDLVADSIDVALPGQRLRELNAIGGARLDMLPDSTKIVSTERDWLQGDTVLARFDSLPAAGDTSSRPVLRRLRALGGARSLQQIGPDSGRTDHPSLHYVAGRTIDIAFDSGAVQRITVAAPDSGQTVGLFLDATGRTSTAGTPGGASTPTAPAPTRPPAAGRPPTRPADRPRRPSTPRLSPDV